MEIQCPGCGRTVKMNETGEDIVCPHCQRTLEVAMGHEGFALVGALDPPPGSSELPDATDAGDDPVIEDYTQWRGRAVFIMLFGVVCALILAFSVSRGVLDSGMYYFQDVKNQFFAGIFLFLSTVCLGGGAWLFGYLGRERDRYLEKVMSDV
jgi:hypothetical protein